MNNFDNQSFSWVDFGVTWLNNSWTPGTRGAILAVMHVRQAAYYLRPDNTGNTTLAMACSEASVLQSVSKPNTIFLWYLISIYQLITSLPIISLNGIYRLIKSVSQLMQTLVLDYHNKIYYNKHHCKVLVTQTGNTR